MVFCNTGFDDTHIPVLRRLTVTSLERLTIVNHRAASPNGHPRRPLTILCLPRLRHLEVQELAYCKGAISRTLSLFDQQHVAMLTLRFPNSHSVRLPRLTPHIQPTQLEVQCDLYYEDNISCLVESLAATPSVQCLRLHIVSHAVPKDFLRQLAVRPSSASTGSNALLLPELESLSFGDTDDPVWHPEELLDLVESRFRQNPSFALMDRTFGFNARLTFEDPAHTRRWEAFFADR